jgi:ribonucleoside-diphosphate reductase beta chain
MFAEFAIMGISLKNKEHWRNMNKKKLWNPQGCDALKESLINGNPTGMLNFNRSKHKWADSLFKQMLENTWFPEEVDTSDEGKCYKLLEPKEQKMYNLAFAQLSFNDSLQAENLVDNINGYITNKIINACLTRQAFEEVLHSKSYAVLLSDAVGNSDEVFELYRNDLTLNAKNTVIAEQYSNLTDGEVTREKLFYAMVANQILEGIYFLSGFACIYSLSDRMRGSADMVAFIHRDEETHLALFQNMIRTFVKENEDLPWFMIRPVVNKMFDDALYIDHCVFSLAHCCCLLPKHDKL